MYEYTPPVSTACSTPCQFCDFYTQQPYATSLPPPPGTQCLDMEGRPFKSYIASNMFSLVNLN